MELLCGEPYSNHGDIAECLLPLWHALTCAEANHAAYLTALATRQAEALQRWVF